MSDIVFDIKNGIGHILLNRPQALNALNHAMCTALHAQLATWATDARISAIVIQGAGDKAFCAGGDVVGLCAAGKAGSDDWDSFFFDEYCTNHAIATYPKPYIAMLNGIVMGGGAGVSLHGQYRVVTEQFLFAMPETAIGLITDVGMTYILANLPGHIGLYLGLTGARLKAADAVAIGLATHFVRAEKMPALLAAIATEASAIEAVLERFAEPAGDAPIISKHVAIDAHFSGVSVEAIMNSLSMGDDWAVGVRDTLLKMSPTSLKLCHMAITAAKGDSLAACLRREYRIVHQIKYGTDFYEGVRAQLIDKDRKPIWKPAALGDVTDEMIADYVLKPVSGDLVLR
jgi:enoyl-CoA hydratase